MKFSKIAVLLLMVTVLLSACGKAPGSSAKQPTTKIELSNEVVKVNGEVARTDTGSAVYTANDIVYYEAGKDFTYGEGTEKDAHSKEDAAKHTVVHITQAGTYTVSGELSYGQIAVDLGKNAKKDPDAVVTLILNGVDITCEVAPAVIFYNVYECGNTDTEKASKDVDTSAAGANVYIADGTVNTVNGSYVERIYKSDTVVLNNDGTEVEDADKLHKYDGAFYSKMSMNVYGGAQNTGVLNINAENEGLDSELHLTVHGGNIHIRSGNDGINTNEDEVSVTTVNGGVLKITVTGQSGEGDGIDSNGWLVINGGTVVAAACSDSADAGIDSDKGIHINGGTVIATGNMLDRIEDGGQTYAVFDFAKKQNGGGALKLKNADGESVMQHTAENAYSILVYSSSGLTAGAYTLWSGDKQLAGQSGGMAGGFGRPGVGFGGAERPELPENVEPPAGDAPQDRPQPPNGEEPPGGQKPPAGAEPPEKPDGQADPIPNPNGNGAAAQGLTGEFQIVNGANRFTGITYLSDSR